MFSRMNLLIWKILEKMTYDTVDSCYFLMQLMAWFKISIPRIQCSGLGALKYLNLAFGRVVRASSLQFGK